MLIDLNGMDNRRKWKDNASKYAGECELHLSNSENGPFTGFYKHVHLLYRSQKVGNFLTS
jgi:hypothetical protein